MSRLFDLRNVSALKTTTYDDKTPKTGDRRGNGLGMLVCKRLVEDAGGVMVVASEVGKGTRVWVVWPRG